MNKYVVRFLCSFFRLFSGYIENIKVAGNKVTGVISYEDESGRQSFSWNTSNLNFVVDGINILDYIIDKNLARGDKIILSRENLVVDLVKIGWKENEVNSAIDFLLGIKIRMVDYGKETDSFFIHF
jgi:hypothetical protein